MSPTFVTNETEDEDVLFASFGALKKGQDPKKSILVKEGESITGVITDIGGSEAGTYKKIFRLKVDKQEKVVILLGTTDLNNKMGHGTVKAKLVAKKGDMVKVTYKGKTTTGKGRPFYSFDVGIAQA